jgi:hypothetical protein
MRDKRLAAMTALAATLGVSGAYLVDTYRVDNVIRARLDRAEGRHAFTRLRVELLEADVLKLRGRVEKTEADDLLAFQVISSHGRRLRRFERAIPIEAGR